ncbi:MAG: FHA domain-containing protein [Paracoccaceae bacterium]
MATSGSQFLLKILNGSQIGAEVSLDAGEYSFGKGAEADLQFADLSLQDVHGRIRLRDGKLELRAETGNLTTSTGLEIAPGDTQWHEIAQLDSVTAGTTRFAVGSPGANWTELIGQTASGVTAAPRRRNTGTGSSRLAMLGWPVAIGALSLAFLFASDMIDLGDGTKAVRNLVGEAELTDTEKVAAALDALPFTDALSVETAVDGRIGVTGYVGTLAERRAVQNALAETGVPVSRTIQVRDVLRNDVQGLLDSQQADMNVEITPTGEAVLSGTMLDPDKAREITALIGREVIGLSGVRNALLTAETYLDRVEGLIDQAQLQDLVLLRLDGILIEATGLVPREKIDNWVGFIRAYSDDYADVIPLRSFVVLDDPENPGQPGQPILIGSSGFDPSGVARVLDPALLAQSQDIVIADLFANPAAPEDPAQDTPPEPDLDPATERLLTLLDGDPAEIEAALGLPSGTIDPALLATVRAGVASGAVDVQQILTGVPQEVGERIQAILNGEDPAAEATEEPGTVSDATPPALASVLPIDIFTFLNSGPTQPLPGTVSDDTPLTRGDPNATAPGDGSDVLPGTQASTDDTPADGTDIGDAPAEGVAPDPLGVATAGVSGFDSGFRNLVRVTGDFLGGRLEGVSTGDLPSIDVMSPRLVNSPGRGRGSGGRTQPAERPGAAGRTQRRLAGRAVLGGRAGVRPATAHRPDMAGHIQHESIPGHRPRRRPEPAAVLRTRPVARARARLPAASRRRKRFDASERFGVPAGNPAQRKLRALPVPECPALLARRRGAEPWRPALRGAAGRTEAVRGTGAGSVQPNRRHRRTWDPRAHRQRLPCEPVWRATAGLGARIVRSGATGCVGGRATDRCTWGLIGANRRGAPAPRTRAARQSIRAHASSCPLARPRGSRGGRRVAARAVRCRLRVVPVRGSRERPVTG